MNLNRVELSKEQKKRAVQEIKGYFAREREEPIGDLAGEAILDIILNTVGPLIYNQAILDVQKYMSEKIEEIDGFII